MKAEFEKKMKIACALLSFCHMHGATEFHLDIKINNDSAESVIKASPACISGEAMEEMRKKLSAPRHREIEQDFWALMGESEDYCELTLAGMMSDEAEAKCENGELTITIKRSE
jgi:HSP20 family molecular chaperone IbpA